MATQVPEHLKVFIVLATWNGEDFVAEQIESIQAQTESNWTLLIRDDGSTDGTTSVLKEFCSRDSRIQLLSDTRERLGPAQSFGVLMQAALDRSADYVFLSDQDDVWDQGKIAGQLQLMLNTEIDTGRIVPTLIHSDLTVTNCDLDVQQPSFYQTEKIPDGTSGTLAALLTRNYVPGCSMLLNRSLIELALPLPPAGMMHDHWAILCAAAGGKVNSLQHSLMRYRRHEKNVTPTGMGSESLLARMLRVCSGKAFSSEILERRWQSVEAARLLLERLPPDRTASRRLLRDFSHAFSPEVSTCRKIAFLRKLGIPVGYSLARAIVYYAQICRLGPRVRNPVVFQHEDDSDSPSEKE